jgi:hypothetical protein
MNWRACSVSRHDGMNNNNNKVCFVIRVAFSLRCPFVCRLFFALHSHTLDARALARRSLEEVLELEVKAVVLDAPDAPVVRLEGLFDQDLDGRACGVRLAHKVRDSAVGDRPVA